MSQRRDTRSFIQLDGVFQVKYWENNVVYIRNVKENLSNRGEKLNTGTAACITPPYVVYSRARTCESEVDGSRLLQCGLRSRCSVLF